MDEFVEAGKNLFGLEAEIIRQVKLPKCLGGKWPFYKHRWGESVEGREDNVTVGMKVCKNCNVVFIEYLKHEEG